MFEIGETYKKDNHVYLAWSQSSLLTVVNSKFYIQSTTKYKEYKHLEDFSYKAVLIWWKQPKEVIDKVMHKLLRYNTLTPAKNTVSTTLTLAQQQELGYIIRSHRHSAPGNTYLME